MRRAGAAHRTFAHTWQSGPWRKWLLPALVGGVAVACSPETETGYVDGNAERSAYLKHLSEQVVLLCENSDVVAGHAISGGSSVVLSVRDVYCQYDGGQRRQATRIANRACLQR